MEAEPLRRLRLTASCSLAVFLLGLLLGPTGALAGTTGTISGTVRDREGNPVVAATLLVVGTRLGAYSGNDGSYTIQNVPPGTFSVRASRMGFTAVTVEEVVVSADNITRVDFEMGDTTLQAAEVVVVASRPPVDLKKTSSQSNLSTKEIDQLPVQDLEDVVNLQAGVVDGHFRGGRQGEVQYQVDGVSVNNAFDNKSALNIDRSLLQEVQVISGTFDAEYGQAMSGVVNAVLKRGGEEFNANAEVFTGGFVFPGREEARKTDDTVRPTAIQNYQLTLDGPLPFGGLTYLVSGRRYVFDDFVYGERRFDPTDRADFENQVYTPSGDGEKVALGYTREWSGAAKLATSTLDNDKLSYQAILSHSEGRRNNWAFRFNPDGLSTQETFAVTHGLDWTHTFSATTFLDVSLRQNFFRYEDFLHEDVYDPAYDAAGPVQSNVDYEDGAVVQGAEFTRYLQETNSLVLKTSVVSQLNPEHQAKVGGEVSLPAVRFGTPGYLSFATVDGVEQVVRHVDEPPDFPGVSANYPVIAAAFVQDQMELPHLTVRAGLRLDYFDARATIPSDLANPANAIDGAPESRPQDTTTKVALAPRLGIAYPIEDKAAIHVAYGHFYQSPAIGTIFSNSDYGVLRNLQAGSVNYGVLGNPDVKPERTVQYEIGYKQIITDDLGFDLTVFYKDIRDLVGVEFIETYTGASYARLTNVDFGSVFGITLAIDHRRFGPFHVALDYTLLEALGNASDPNETATRAAAGEDPRPRQVYFDWDQRHTLNLTATLAEPDNYVVSAVLKASSGQPYTPVLDTGFGFGMETNSGRKPGGFLVDLRAEKTVALAGRAGVFMRMFNVFDTRFFNGAVYSSTGSPYYSRFPVTDRVALADPTRFYAPRRVEVGMRVSF